MQFYDTHLNEMHGAYMNEEWVEEDEQKWTSPNWLQLQLDGKCMKYYEQNTQKSNCFYNKGTSFIKMDVNNSCLSRFLQGRVTFLFYFLAFQLFLFFFHLLPSRRIEGKWDLNKLRRSRSLFHITFCFHSLEEILYGWGEFLCFIRWFIW